MGNIKYNKNSNDTCTLCLHQYSIHYSDYIHGLGSKDIKDVHSGCTMSTLLMEVNALVMVL
jgi:hypothetical protein